MYILGETEVLFLNEGITAWKIIKGNKKPEVMPNIASNQDEADTKMFHVAFATEFDNYLIPYED